MSGARREAIRRGAVAVMALLRRDLLAGGRAVPLRLARAAAIVVSSGAVLIAYSASESRFALDATTSIFAMLSFIALLSAPQVAIRALRRERDAGMLDLLGVAGLTPARLALGRILSSFVNLLSLLLATLPALALLAFFGRPTAGELLACIGIQACSWLALSGFAVAVSAWARSSAAAAAIAIGGLVAWSALIGAARLKGVVLSAGGLMSAMLGLSGPILGPSGQIGIEPAQLATYVALHLGLAAIFWSLAGLGIRIGDRSAKPVAAAAAARVRRREPSAWTSRMPAWLRRLAGKAPRLRDAWPLTWLLQRRAPVARPRTFAPLLLIPPLALTWKGEDGVLISAWILAVLALLIALFVPGFQVNAAREHHQWDSLIATAMDGRQAVFDLVRAALTTSAMPLAASFVAILLVGLYRLAAADLARSGAACVALVATWVLAAVLGAAAGLIARSSAGAVAACGYVTVLVGGGPFVVFACGEWLRDVGAEGYRLIALMFGALLIGATLMGLAALRWVNVRPAALVSVPGTWAFMIAPLFMMSHVDRGPYFAAGGLAGLMAITWGVEAPGILAPPALPLLFALPHVLLAVMLLAALARRADRWLGRPA